MAFPTTAILDNFNRADEGPPPSANWTTKIGTGHKVSGNTLIPDTDSATQISTWNVFTALNVENYVTLATVLSDSNAGGFTLYGRVDSGLTQNMQIGINRVSGSNNDTVRFTKRVSSVNTQLGATVDIGAEWTNSDVVGFRLVNATIEAFRNGASLGSRDDTDVNTAGYLALGHGGGITEHWVIDNSGGGTISQTVLGSMALTGVAGLLNFGIIVPTQT